MLKHIDGDIFEQDLDVVIHQANCRATMGSGIAATVRKEFPAAYEADKSFKIPVGRGRLGSFTHAYVEKRNKSGIFLVINAYGQDNWGGSGVLTEYDALERALRGALHMLEKEKDFKALKIGVPYLIGCDRARGDWTKVSSILEGLSTEFGIDIIICKFDPSK